MRAHYAYDSGHSRQRCRTDGRGGRGSHPHPSRRSGEKPGRPQCGSSRSIDRRSAHLSEVRPKMTDQGSAFQTSPHSHVFLGDDHERAERRTWAVIILCTAMMIAEIVGGALFGSLALIADGLHMSTHAGALLLAEIGRA